MTSSIEAGLMLCSEELKVARGWKVAFADEIKQVRLTRHTQKIDRSMMNVAVVLNRAHSLKNPQVIS